MKVGWPSSRNSKQTPRGLVAGAPPVLEACRCLRTWSGLYEQCELDGNPVIGRSPLQNFFIAGGFSGHGMMHAPAAGRAIAELIVHGRYETLDLTRLGYARVSSHSPHPERGII